MSLTNPNKVITEERLSAFYQDILPYLGGMPEILANKFSRSDIYSTEEKMIGQWTDGRPLYQKTINFGTLPNATTKSVAHGISNFGVLVNVVATIYKSNDYATIPYVYNIPSGQTENWSIEVNFDNTNINIVTKANYSSSVGYVTLQYTKTTDSPISIGVDTDYSTTEKIVGIDTDGKWIYQKTIPVTLPTTSDYGIIVTEDYNIGASIYRLKNIIGEFKSSSGACFILPAFSTSNIEARASALVLDNASSTPNILRILNGNKGWNGITCNVTLQYTKTS